jgi:hypothetical protein
MRVLATVVKGKKLDGESHNRHALRCKRSQLPTPAVPIAIAPIGPAPGSAGLSLHFSGQNRRTNRSR